jgi:hypothetical protein
VGDLDAEMRLRASGLNYYGIGPEVRWLGPGSQVWSTEEALRWLEANPAGMAAPPIVAEPAAFVAGEP